MDEKWYVATLLITCRVGAQEPTMWTCDEQVRVIRARDPETAYTKAYALGKIEECQYANQDNVTVSWEFAGLVDLAELADDDIEDGTEIRSRIFKRRNPTRLIVSKEELSVFL